MKIFGVFLRFTYWVVTLFGIFFVFVLFTGRDYTYRQQICSKGQLIASVPSLNGQYLANIVFKPNKSWFNPSATSTYAICINSNTQRKGASQNEATGYGFTCYETDHIEIGQVGWSHQNAILIERNPKSSILSYTEHVNLPLTIRYCSYFWKPAVIGNHPVSVHLWTNKNGIQNRSPRND